MDKEIRRRLLKLFPKRSLQKYFRKKGTQGELSASLSSTCTDKQISDFAYECFDLTKKHVYLFQHKIGDLEKVPATCISAITPLKVTMEKNKVRHFYLHDVEYDIIKMTAPVEKVKVQFKWPIVIELDASICIVTYTILEKNIDSYFEGNVQIVTQGKNVEEKDVNLEIEKSLRGLNGISVLDINKGVKHLWDTDFMDSQSVRWKSGRSTVHETMDENFTFKKDRSLEYNEVKKAPLFRTVFKIIDKKEGLPEMFAVNPTKGLIVFPRYAKKIGDHKNVIQNILANN
jgi:hypothetical protein